MTLGQKLISLRKARGMTQEELSEAIGVTRQTISKWELDTSTPDLDYLCKLCDLFGVTADYLIRPGMETPETAQAPTDTPPVPDAPTPAAESIPKREPNTRPAGWLFQGFSFVLFIFAMIALFLNEDAVMLFILAAIAQIFSMELLLIRRNSLRTVMWTAWGVLTLLLTLMTGTPFAFLVLFRYVAMGAEDIVLSWAGIATILWVFYTAFCVGVTVGRMVKRQRQKKEQS